MLIDRIKVKIQRELLNAKIKRIKKTLENDSFTIISQNCIGGVFYHDMGMQFLSPTINLFFYASDFQKLIKNLKSYMQEEIQVYINEKDGYPIGIINDIEVHFLHYETCEEAKAAWEKRKLRIDYDKILILSTDRDGFDKKLFEEWKKVPYAKVLFTSQKNYSTDKDSLYFPEYEELGMIPDLIPNREFYRNEKLIKTVNEMAKV